MTSRKSLSPEEAAAIWQRAAHLQAEAERRLDERSRALTASVDAPGEDPHHFSEEEVRTAAVDAGIAPEFVTLALAEQSTDAIGPLPSAKQKAATRFLGTAERLLEVSRTVDRPPDVVYASLQRVLPAHPWLLRLREVTGDPMNGGSLIFEVPSLVEFMTSSTLTSLAYNAHSVDATHFQLMLRPVPGSETAACEIVLRAGLQRSVRRNFRFGRWSSGVGGVIGGGGATLGALAFGVSGALLALPFVAGAALLGTGTAVGYRAMYRGYLRKLNGNLEDLVGAIALDARTGGGFAPQFPAGQQSLPRSQ